MAVLRAPEIRRAVDELGHITFAVVKDELNFHLVLHGLKPATMISIVRLDRQDIEGRASRSGMHFAFSPRLGPEMSHYGDSLFLAMDSTSLSKALSAATDFEFGVSLGFPRDAALEFEMNSGLGWRWHEDKVMAMCDGAPISIALAYISHVPAQFDLRRGFVAESSIQQGLEYRRFIMDVNPDLASRVEGSFIEMLTREFRGWDGKIVSEEEIRKREEARAQRRRQNLTDPEFLKYARQ